MAANTRAGMRGMPASARSRAKRSMNRRTASSSRPESAGWATPPPPAGDVLRSQLRETSVACEARERPAPSPEEAVKDQMATTISISGLVKTFGPTRALDGLDLEVRTGEVHGFLGPNGAGETTTLRVLLGLLRADAGTARLLGGDPWRDVATLHRRLAYVPGDVTLWPSLSGGEVIDLLARLRGGVDPKRRATLLERFDLNPRKKARTYSKGNRQKVALVAALASDVELLILDEPTSGLDPLMEEVFREVVQEVTDREGRTVLLSSHILSEVEALCDRVTIIRAGRAVESG